MPELPDAPDALISSFVEAFNAGDKPRCVDFYAEDASIRFMAKVYRGRTAIEQWLEQRFASGATILQVNDVQQETDTLTVRASITSRKLQAWRLGTVNGRATIRLDEEGRIAECQLGMDGLLSRRG